jgi:hypothetical protein
MPTMLTKIDNERATVQARESTVIEKMCRITLSKDSPRPYEWSHCTGRGPRTTTRQILKPGESLVRTLDMAESHFGPFSRFAEYMNTTDERLLDALRDRISIESARYLMRYDYPRESGEGYKPKMTPTGPHRSPDMTMTVIAADGTESEPIRLYEVYGIGEFDDLKDSFAPKETQASIEARFQAELHAKDEVLADYRRELAKLSGMVEGLIAVGAVKTAPAVKAKPVKADPFAQASA